MAARKEVYEDVATIKVSTDGRPSSEVVDEIVYKLWLWFEDPSDEAHSAPRGNR
jgi:shikimate kinase